MIKTEMQLAEKAGRDDIVKRLEENLNEEIKKSILNLKNEYNDISFIEQALLSNNSLRCMYAIRSCVVNNFRTKKIIDTLKELKTSDLIEWNSCKISNCAYAVLHLLGIETYNGNEGQVQDLIDTVFFTK